MERLDYRALGLKVGLEIHQQLPDRKLFCSCPCDLSEKVDCQFERMLRPSPSEMGEVDRAALEEAKKSLVFTYESTPSDCLVEADEEPPHAANQEAVTTALIFSRMVKAIPVEEIQFMRKIVIDGSNTAGFQRTALVAMDGMLDFDGKIIKLSTLCLEEDAARRISEEKNRVTFRLDRLGIPLIEIATGPEIETPEEARLIAQRLGSLLRATHRVRRGIGSIREDLNISISGGARVEIKGVQDLDLLPKYIENEAKRQLALIDVKGELARRGVREVQGKIVDVTGLLSDTKSKMISNSISRGGVVLAVYLPGFDGLMAPDDAGTKRLGIEMAMHAKMAGVGGIFHSDELPNYGMTEKEVLEIRRAIGAEKLDGFALVAAPKERGYDAIQKVIERAIQAIIGVPEETRDPLPDGTTAYSRPLPGRARMYPETDVPPILVSSGLLAKIEEELPEPPEDTIHRLQKLYQMNIEQASTIVANGDDQTFELIVKARISPKIAARTLINTASELRSEGIDISAIGKDELIDVLERVEGGEFAKEAIPQILKRMVLSNESAETAMRSLGLRQAEDAELDAIIDRILSEKMQFIVDKKERSIPPLMGILMKELRGMVDGKILNKKLTMKVSEILAGKK